MSKSNFFYNEFISSLGYVPTQSQDDLLANISDFLSSDDGDIHIVNGYAGTGKTTAIASVVATLSKFDIPFKLMAPTGRAAKNLQKYTGKKASTIHLSIYKLKTTADDGVGYYVMGPNKLKDAVIIVDEVSLIGIDSDTESMVMFGEGNLLKDLIAFTRRGINCKLILIGDGAQLPPINMDQSPALSEDYMYGYGGVSFSYLTDVVRQQKDNGIIKNATILRNLITNYTNPVYLHDICLDVNNDDVESINGGDLIDCLSDSYSKYGEDEVMVLCRSNKYANRYNLGIRNQIHYKEDRLEKGDKLMIVKNWYNPKKVFQSTEKEAENDIDFIANGEMVKLVSAKHYTDRYNLEFADATLCLIDNEEKEVNVKICLDTLLSETASLTKEQQNELYHGVYEDYSDLGSKTKIRNAIRQDPYFASLQIKYANAITCHKSQGGQWDCVFIHYPFWEDYLTLNDLKWLYTALTRAVKKVYLVNFQKEIFVQ